MPALADAVQENASGDPMYTVEAPPAYAMIGDLLIARPFLIAATAVGAVAFVVSLPFTAASGRSARPARRWWSIGQGSLRPLPGLHHQRL